MTMIVTKRYKLNKPIAFTDEMTVTIMTGREEIMMSNGDETVHAYPVGRAEKKTPPTGTKMYVDEAKGIDDIEIPDSTGGD